MKKSLKKLTVLLMAVAMVITSMSFSAFADDNKVVKIKNVEDGATVTAYKIVGLSDGKWVTEDGITINDIQKPTAKEITDIAKAKRGTTGIDFGERKANGNYEKEMPDAGMYLVLVTKTGSATVYNPMIVSVDYKDTTTGRELQGGEVDAKGNYVINGQTAYAKSTTPEPTKKIVDKPTNNNVEGDTTDKGDTHKIGDYVKYEVKTAVPSYSDEYWFTKDGKDYKPSFTITDVLSTGLTLDQNSIVVTGAEANEYSITKSAQGYTITFTDAYLKKGGNVTITYRAQLNDNASRGFDANTNKVTVEYDHDPKYVEQKKKFEEETYHYTFDIDGDVFGSRKGKEVIKVGVTKDVDGNETRIYAEKDLPSAMEVKPLSGAQFKICKRGETTPLKDINGNDMIATTDSEGKMFFKGLDAGEYDIIEVSAPAGYALDTTAVPVSIKAELDTTTGKLKSYEIKINNAITTTYTWNNAGTDIVVNNGEGDNTAEILNRKTGTLPSTGGMGTILFTVAGIAIMAIAAGLFIANRKASK